LNGNPKAVQERGVRPGVLQAAVLSVLASAQELINPVDRAMDALYSRDNGDSDDSDDDYRHWGDDYYIPSISVHNRVTSLNPDDRIRAIRYRFIGVSQTYIERCSTAVGIPPHSAPYVAGICCFLPLRQVVIGQSPYSSDILPRYSSAFSFNCADAEFWTPTSQVLAQCMNVYENVPLATALEYVSHSYLLACRGVVLLNVYPYQKLNDQCQAKMLSFFAELVSEMIMASALMKGGIGGGGERYVGERLYQVEFGDEAKIAGNCIWACMKSLRGILSRVSVVNPVWISRTFGGESRGKGPAPTQASIALCRHYRSLPPGLRASEDARAIMWHHYSEDELSYLSPARTLRLVCTIAKSESINTLSKEFDQRITNMSTYVPAQESREHSGDAEDTPSYAQRVLSKLESDSTSIAASNERVVQELRSIVSKLRPEDSAQVESMLSVLETSVKAIVVAAGFYTSVPGVLGSESSAISLGTNTLPPLVRAYKPEVRPPGRSGLTMRKKGAAQEPTGVKHFSPPAEVDKGKQKGNDGMMSPSRGKPVEERERDDSGNITPKSHTADPHSHEDSDYRLLPLQIESPSLTSWSASGHSEVSAPSLEVPDDDDPFADDYGLYVETVERVGAFGISTSRKSQEVSSQPRTSTPSSHVVPQPSAAVATVGEPKRGGGGKKKVLKINRSKR